ncbi:MAG: hypothetical protein MUP98_13975 [Candidatus Aminicenantes bacterium]|nr:hypothetical protein [Candidatus Aminicenantes bacterium]
MEWGVFCYICGESRSILDGPECGLCYHSARVVQQELLMAAEERGKRRKEGHNLLIIEEACPRIPSQGWAEMIRKVYEVDPLTCPKCQGRMRIIAFLIDYAAVDRIINHLKLTFLAERPPPPQVASLELLVAAESPAEYLS